MDISSKVRAYVCIYGIAAFVWACVYLRLGCVHVCGARATPATRNGKVLCLYAYISGKGGKGKPPDSLSCTLTRRRFPIFQPKLSTEKPSDSPSSLSLSLSRSLARIVIPFLAATTLVCNVKPSYSDKIERIPPKRLCHATSVSHSPDLHPSTRSKYLLFISHESPVPSCSGCRQMYRDSFYFNDAFFFTTSLFTSDIKKFDVQGASLPITFTVYPVIFQ